MADHILIPIAPGELIDKLTILRLKEQRISDAAKVANVRVETDALSEIARSRLPESPELTRLWQDLYLINAQLWEIEDDIRTCEADQNFGEEFIRLARAVYITNDRRAAVKKQINTLLGSDLVEEKSYTDHGARE